MKHAEIRKFPKLDYAVNEAMNTLATNLSYCGDEYRVIEITSRYAHEGKSTVAMNLMRTIAGLQKTVVLLDADLRQSMLVNRFQIQFDQPKPDGLAQFLAGLCGMDDTIYETNVPGAYIVPVGRHVTSSLQLLASKHLPDMIDYLASIFDVVLVDTPPAGTIVDAIEIAKYCDGALMVVGHGVGHKKEIAELKSAIAKTGCQVLGVALNNVNLNTLYNKYYYYGGKGYGSYGRYGKMQETDFSSDD